MRVGVLMTDGLGDVVCASAMVADIRKAWPTAYVCAITRSEALWPFFRGGSRVDAFIKYDPVEGNTPGRVLSLVRALRRQRLDVFVVATDIDSRKAPCLAFASGARVRVGEGASMLARLYTRSTPRNSQQHKVLSNRDIVRLLGIEATSLPTVDVASEDVDHVRRRLDELGLEDCQRLLAVHPGSSEALSHKRWGTDKYEEALRALGVGGVRTVLLGAGPEVPACDALADRLSPLAVSLAGRLSIGQTAALLKRSVAALGADSGIMHLAAALGTPTIALFGPTDERRTAPYASRRILTEDISCRPCFDHLPYGCGVPICMSGIAVARVCAAVQEVIADGRGPRARLIDSLTHVD
jgi:ADP-heptose:LPS heptosyltransferase